MSHDREVWSFEVLGGSTSDDGTEVARLVVASGDAHPKVYKLSLEEKTMESKVTSICVYQAPQKNYFEILIGWIPELLFL